jgi:ribosomal protein L16/L10AE
LYGEARKKAKREDTGIYSGKKHGTNKMVTKQLILCCLKEENNQIKHRHIEEARKIIKKNLKKKND